MWPSLLLTVCWVGVARCGIKTGSFSQMFTDFKPEADRPVEFVGLDVGPVTFISGSQNLACALYCYTLAPCFIYCFDEESSSCLLAHDVRQPFDPLVPTVPIPQDVETYSCYRKNNFYGNITATPNVGVDMYRGANPNLTFAPSYQKPSWISSVRDNTPTIYPIMANDGNRNTDFFNKTCIHTMENSGDPIPWWYVDLLATYAIYSVNITNRQGSLRLHDVEVRAGYYKFNSVTNKMFQKNQLCFSNKPPLNGVSLFKGCDQAPTAGRYVSLQIVRFCGTQPNCMSSEANNTNMLIVCEVDVYGVKLGNVTMGDH